MKFEEFADVIDAELDVKRYPNAGERWTATFRGCEVKDGGALAGMYGQGHSAFEAIESYAQKIAGQRLVFYAMTDQRREYIAPQKFD